MKKIFLFAIFCLGLFLRILWLEKIPAGLTDDQAALGYNAYLIAKTGRDEWGKILPLQFQSFGDYKLPVYIYLTSIFFLFAPLSIFWTKMTSVLLGSLTIILVYYFVLLFFKNEKAKQKIALFSSLLLTFNPWHIGLSRTASEANIGLFFFTLSLYFLKHFLNKKIKKGFLFLSLVFAFLCFYSYHIYRLILPLSFVYLYFFDFRERDKKRPNRLLAKLLLPGLVLIFFLFFSTQGKFLIRLYQTSFLSSQGIVNEISSFRQACLPKLPPFLCQAFYNRPLFWAKTFLFNYLNHLSFQFLFFSGFEKGYTILPQYPFFYSISFFFFILGFIFSVKDKRSRFFYFLLFIVPLAGALASPGNFARAFPLVLPAIIFISWGIVHLINFCRLKKILFLLILPLAIYFFSLTEFLIGYYTYFPFQLSKYTHFEYQLLFDYLDQVQASYDYIYISKSWHDARQYIFYLFHFKIPTDKYFNLEKEVEINQEGWVWVKKMGKFEFIDSAGDLNKYPSKSLLVIDPKAAKDFPQTTQLIRYPNGTTAFNVYDLDEVRKD